MPLSCLKNGISYTIELEIVKWAHNTLSALLQDVSVDHSRGNIFGSFVTDKPDPQDIDIFLLMEDIFDVRQVSGEARILFDHMAAQDYEGASIFWLRRIAALDGEAASIEHWQVRRDGKKRGIVEVLKHD